MPAAEIRALSQRPDLALLDDPHRRAEFARLGLPDGEVGRSTERLTRLAARILGAEFAQVSLLDKEQIIASTAGFEVSGDERRSPLSDSLCGVCVASGAPLLIEDAPHHPWVAELSPVRSGRVRRYLGVPLMTSGGEAVGALCVYDGSELSWPPDARDALADLAAAVVTEIELRAAAADLRAVADKLTHLQNITARLSSAATIEAIAQVVVEGIVLLGRHGVVGILSSGTDTLLTWPTPGLPPDLAHGLQTISTDASAQISDAVRTGEEIVLQTSTEIAARYPETLCTYSSQEVLSALAVPGRAGGEVLAGLAIGYDREYAVGESQLAYAHVLADLLAQAVQRAHLYERERNAAQMLQVSLLPSFPGPLPGARAAVSYRPADHLVGGDWYDVFGLPGDRIGIAVGDVAGHDLPAAAAMGRLQVALRAFATTASGPAEVLAALDGVASDSESRLVTVGYGEHDPATRTLRYSCAGHLPPLVVADGEPRYLWKGRSVPLGFGQYERSEASLTLPVGARLLWCTDGLIERRGETLDTGLDRLANTVRSLGTSDIQQWCDQVVEALTAGQQLDDDIAVVCLQLDP